MRCFCLNPNACQTSSLTHLNRNTINRYFHLIRQRVAQFSEQGSSFQGEIEVYESYFGEKRIKGKRGRGPFRKTPVSGMLRRNGKVYTEIVPDCAKATLQAIIPGKADLESVIHSDSWRSYNGLIDPGYKNIFECIIATMNLLVGKVTSTMLNPTVHSQKEDFCSFIVSLNRPSIYISS